jgi:hypothetical protein
MKIGSLNFGEVGSGSNVWTLPTVIYVRKQDSPQPRRCTTGIKDDVT